MLTKEERQQVERLIKKMEGITPAQQQAVAALGLPAYESLVLAYLQLARHLLTEDSTHSWKQRESAWHLWRANIVSALEGCLRYRENEPLVLTVGVCAALFPLVHRGAGLLAYKVLDDVIAAAQRRGYTPKRERTQHLLRVRDVVRRISVWRCPSGRLALEAELTETERSSGECVESAGLLLEYYDPAAVMALVACIVPVAWQPQPDGALIVPATAGDLP